MALGVSGTEAARLWVVVGADTNQLNRGLGQAERRVQGFGSELGGLAKAAGGIYAVQQAFDATIGAAIDWESQFAGVEKTVDGTTRELAGLESELRGMARSMPVARGELAAIAEQAGALGIATQDIGEFTEVVAQIGATTNVSSEQAATALGQLSNVLGLTQQDFDNFGAALVDLGNKGASTEAQILEIASRAGAGADLIGIAADATLGWSAAVANLGIEAEAGGSSLQRFFLGAAQHVGEAGEELRLMADTARTSVGEFTDLFNNDASAALQKFVAGLGQLTQAEQLAVLEALGFNDVRIQRALLGLAGDADNLTDSLEIGAEAWADNTALVEEYGKRAKTTASRVEVLGNRISDLGVRLGESQGGPLNFFLDLTAASITGWERAFDDLGNSAQLLAGHFGDMGDATNALAERMDEPFKRVNHAVTRYMRETGATLEEAIEAVGLYGTGNTAATEQAGQAWEDYQNQITPRIADVTTTIGDGASAARSAWSSEMDNLDDETRQALEDARQAAIAGTAGVMDALLNLGSAEDYATAWEDFLSGAEEVWTDAKRSAFIAGQFAGDAFDEGLHSDDSARVEGTVTYVNEQLAAFELMNPGALAIGRDVPASLQAGMEEIFPELNAYLLERHNETLATLTLDEAEQLGVDGIYLWWQGQLSQEMNATTTARNIAFRAKEALQEPDFYGTGAAASGDYAAGIDEGEGRAVTQAEEIARAARMALFNENWYGAGYSVGVAWANGLRSASHYARLMAWELAASANPALHGRSPPPEGPLSDIDQGGFNIGVAWAEALGSAAGVAQANAYGLAAAAQSALAGNLGSDVAFGIDGPGRGSPWQGSSGDEGGFRDLHVSLTITGGEPVVRSEEDLARVVGRVIRAAGKPETVEARD